MAHYADGSYRYWSIVEEDNEPSLAVFEKLGFISCERINRHRKFLISIYGSGVSAGN
jgi:RimJ/RimL family protein N-acetyltransferase